MSIEIGKYKFDGPYTDTNKLEDKSGIYVILCKRDGKNFVVDIGESAEVQTRVANHDRKDCWSRNCTGTLTVSVLYTPNKQQQGRMLIEQELRKQYNPPCGKK